MERWAMHERAAVGVKPQSGVAADEPRTEGGNWGLGWGGGGVTNWKRIVMSPTVILPRERSSRSITQLWPWRLILPACLSWAREMISLPTAIRASMASAKWAT